MDEPTLIICKSCLATPGPARIYTLKFVVLPFISRVYSKAGEQVLPVKFCYLLSERSCVWTPFLLYALGFLSFSQENIPLRSYILQGSSDCTLQLVRISQNLIPLFFCLHRHMNVLISFICLFIIFILCHAVCLLSVSRHPASFHAFPTWLSILK